MKLLTKVQVPDSCIYVKVLLTIKPYACASTMVTMVVVGSHLGADWSPRRWWCLWQPWQWGGWRWQWWWKQVRGLMQIAHSGDTLFCPLFKAFTISTSGFFFLMFPYICSDVLKYAALSLRNIERALTKCIKDFVFDSLMFCEVLCSCSLHGRTDPTLHTDDFIFLNDLISFSLH